MPSAISLRDGIVLDGQILASPAHLQRLIDGTSHLLVHGGTALTKPQTIPEGYATVTPWVVTKDTRRLLDFITQAFDAEELGRVEVEGGGIGHAEARIGNSIIMMFDSPFPVATPGLLRLYVEDGDAVFNRAVAAGATPVTQMTALAWGDRVGRVRDPLGNIWWIQERVEEPAPDEVARRLQDSTFTEAMQYLQSSLPHCLDSHVE
jgi:uncharacterized glyoxalase superfamily protein PhnB